MSQRGFTLIELAIVLAITGILIGGGLLTVGPLLDKARTNQTNATLDQVENALVLYVIRSSNNLLPCPADGTVASNNAQYGIANCSTSLANSVIPWRTLGIDESYSMDGWGRRLSYYPATIGTAGSTKNLTDGTTSIQRTSGVNYPTGTYMTVTDVASGQPITPTSGSDQAAYVLISHGKSGWYGFAKNGASIAISKAAFTGGPKKCNSAPASCTLPPPGNAVTNTFVSGSGYGPYPPTSNLYFDDIVRWRSPAMLIQLCGAGACGNS